MLMLGYHGNIPRERIVFIKRYKKTEDTHHLVYWWRTLSLDEIFETLACGSWLNGSGWENGARHLCETRRVSLFSPESMLDSHHSSIAHPLDLHKFSFRVVVWTRRPSWSRSQKTLHGFSFGTLLLAPDYFGFSKLEDTWPAVSRLSKIWHFKVLRG
jgi:hypothetical protein